LTLPHEVIVSDGGSSDRTVELAAKSAAALVVFSGPGHRLRGGEMTVPRAPVAISSSFSMPTASSRNLSVLYQALSQFQKNPNLVALTAYLHVFSRGETFGDKLVGGVANLGLRLANNMFSRGVV
jgi:glycosyltransferase involved in cell wall biosynthesis